MTQPTQISNKVNSTTLDTMYNNFVKMTDWLIKGKASHHAMPAPYARLFDSAELVQEQQQIITEQNNVIGGLQQRLASADGRITALETTLQAVNQTLAQIVELVNAQTLTTSVAQDAEITMTNSEPAVKPIAPVEPELVLADLDTATAEVLTVSPNEEAIQVSAAAVGAGNIDPASYAAIDAEIDKLLMG